MEVIEKIIAAAPKAEKRDHTPDDFLGNVGSELQAAKLQRQNGFPAQQIPYSVTKVDNAYYQFRILPGRGPQHSDGAALVYVNRRLPCFPLQAREVRWQNIRGLGSNPRAVVSGNQGSVPTLTG